MEENTEIRIASMPKRVLAFLIDELAVAIFLLIIFYDPIMGIVNSVPSAMTEEAKELFRFQVEAFSRDNLFLIIAFKLSYHSFLIWQNQGMTLGKYLMKIRVVQLGTEMSPSFLSSLGRASLRVVNEMLFYIGFILALVLPYRQTLHDKFTNCVVVDV